MISRFLFCLAGLLALSPLYSAQDSATASSVMPVEADFDVRQLDTAFDAINLEYTKQAGNVAVEQLIGELVQWPSSAKRLAILPLDRDFDNDYLTMQARNLLTTRGAGAGYSHVLAENSPVWGNLMAEIRRGDRYADTMDPTTVQKFGRIQGVQGVIVGRVTGIFLATHRTGGAVRFSEQERKKVQVRVSFQAYEVETGKQLWGSERTGSAWLPYDDSIVVPGSRTDWIKWGAIGLVGLLVLGFIFARILSAARPR